MYKLALAKPDGRALTLYARQPIDPGLTAPAPSSRSSSSHAPNAHLRWHPLRGEWVAYASHHENHTSRPPSAYDPLAPATDPAHPTEVPAGNWDVAVFDHLFPALTLAARDAPDLIVPTEPGLGTCEVVVFSQDPRASLGTLPLPHLDLLIDVWADRYEELGKRPEIAYVYPFENRGVEPGVATHHPHGEIYAYPIIPPIAARELEQQRAYYERHGTGLLEDLIAREVAEQERMLYQGAHAVAFLPICARYSYEVWVAPSRSAVSFAALTSDERGDFARALKTILLKLDGLHDRPMPYVLAFHQAPTDGLLHPEAHLHAEIYPAMQMPSRVRDFTGSEIGAGVFTTDTLPEEAVKELQAVDVNVEA